MAFDNNLVTAGLKAAIGDFMFSNEKTKHTEPMDAVKLFRYNTPIYKPPKDDNDYVKPKDCIVMKNNGLKDAITIYIVKIDGRKVAIKNISQETTILEVKEILADNEGMYANICRFLYSGKILFDGDTFKQLKIPDQSVFHMIYRQMGGGCPTYHLEPDFFDPKFNYDFTQINDKQSYFYRGGKEYRRPIGSKRYAIKVDGKYSTDDKWLGCNGTKDEWPVAYHGTKENCCTDITKNGFNLDKGKRFLYGRGIYCTPDPETAKQYAVKYSFQGKPFCLIFQVRINPKTMIVAKKAETNGLGEYWLVPNESDIRPYGICVFPA